MKKPSINGKTIRVTVYRSEKLARAAAQRCNKDWLMLGDCGEYWLARPVDCDRLNRAGYEYAR